MGWHNWRGTFGFTGTLSDYWYIYIFRNVDVQGDILRYKLIKKLSSMVILSLHVATCIILVCQNAAKMSPTIEIWKVALSKVKCQLFFSSILINHLMCIKLDLYIQNHRKRTKRKYIVYSKKLQLANSNLNNWQLCV